MKNYSYDPQNFQTVYDNHDGEKIWNYLISNEAILQMKLVTRLILPSILGVDEELRELLGPDTIKDHMVKRMIGHMIRQVMEHEGYSIDTKNVKVAKSKYFQTGYRYKQK